MKKLIPVLAFIPMLVLVALPLLAGCARRGY